MLLSSNEPSKKATEHYRRASLELKPYHANSMVTYYPLGGEFFAALLADLQKANYFILMGYFIVQEGKMWDAIHEILKEKASQGISVFFMYDDFHIYPVPYSQQPGSPENNSD